MKGLVFALLVALAGGCDVVPRQEEAPAAAVIGAGAAGSAGELAQGGAAEEAGTDEPAGTDESAVEARALARGLEAATKVAQQQSKAKRQGLKQRASRRTRCDEITCLIDPTACGGGCIDSGFHRPRPPVPAPPDVLSRADIMAAMSPLRSRVSGCARDGTGASVRVRVTVAASGRPSEVLVQPPVDRDIGKCIQQLVRGARFRATTGGPMTFTFPFVLGH